MRRLFYKSCKFRCYCFCCWFFLFLPVGHLFSIRILSKIYASIDKYNEFDDIPAQQQWFAETNKPNSELKWIWALNWKRLNFGRALNSNKNNNLHFFDSIYSGNVSLFSVKMKWTKNWNIAKSEETLESFFDDGAAFNYNILWWTVFIHLPLSSQNFEYPQKQFPFIFICSRILKTTKKRTILNGQNNNNKKWRKKWC